LKTALHFYSFFSFYNLINKYGLFTKAGKIVLFNYNEIFGVFTKNIKITYRLIGY